jgi:hypothetical protein
MPFMLKYANPDLFIKQKRQRRARDIKSLIKRLEMQLRSGRKILKRHFSNSISIIFIIKNCKGS